MLRKLFKYDFLAIGKNMWIFTIIAICLAVVACFTFNGIYEIGNFIGNAPSDRDMALGVSLMMAAVMLFALCLCGIIAYAVIGMIMILVRYYSNFFTDEGYLTFTLPVKTSTLLHSKILSGISWFAIIGVVVVLSFVAVATTIAAVTGDSYLWEVSDYYTVEPESISVIGEIIVGMTETISFVIAIIEPVLLMFLCVTLASVIARRARVVIGIGLFFAVNSVTSALVTAGDVFMSYITTEYFGYNYYIDTATQSVFYILLYGSILVVSYLLNRYLLKNKLNLI
ncbi:MAG: hypothetical protein IJA52_07880 [Clostridia bacterium]|nr:hypothetical protein [Clostridia bacterium]